MSFAVWSEANGQDDLKWYNGVNDGRGNWTAQIDVSTQKNDTGIYDIHAYGADTAGNTGFMGCTTIDMEHRDTKPPTLSAPYMAPTDTYNLNFSLSASVIDDKSGVANVRFAVWAAAGNGADTKWYNATGSAGTWSVTVNASDFGLKTGVYNVHCYATDVAGNTGFIGSTTINLLPDTSALTMSSLTTNPASPSNTAKTFTVTAANVANTKSGVKNVVFAVWTDKNGQDDLKWVNGTKDSSNNWTATINSADHNNEAGVYNVHAYGINGQGYEAFMGKTTMTLDFLDYLPPTSAAAFMAPKDTYDPNFSLSAAVTDAKSGVGNVRFAVWPAAGNGSDMKWYNATGNAGTWSVTVNASDFGMKTGVYNVHCYATDVAGNTGFIGSTTINLLPDTSALTMDPLTTNPASPSDTAKTFTVTAPNVANAKSGVKNVVFAVWTDKNGQDDLKWVNGTKDSSNNWTATINSADHNNEAGVYNVHAYGINGQGYETFMGSTTMALGFKDYLPPTLTAPYMTPKDTYDPSFSLSAAVTDDKSGVANVRFAVWPAAGNGSDMKWYNATGNAGTWSVTVNASDFGLKTGVYNVHCYATDVAGNTGFIGSTTINLQPDTSALTMDTLTTNPASPSNTAKTFTVTAANVANTKSGVKNVVFAVWTDKNGQDDLKWVNGTKDSSNNWSVTVNSADHNNEAGVYNVHAYGTNGQGYVAFMGSTTMALGFKDYLPPTLTAPYMTPKDTYNPNFSLSASVTDAQSGVANVRFAVWPAAGNGADMKWYNATGNAGTWSVNVNASDFGMKTGVYNVHCYATDVAGNTGFIGSTTINLLPDTSALTMDPLTTNPASPSNTAKTFTVTAPNVANAKSGVKNVVFAVWTDKNGQDDLKWVNGTKDSSNNWTATINSTDHNNEAGVYNVHAYGINGQGYEAYMGSTTMTLG